MENRSSGVIDIAKATSVKNNRVLLVAQLLIQYALGIVMLLYGFQKLTGMQIQVSAWDYTHPLIKTSGRTLTWAFLGYQPWFQFLAGVMETVPGLMLLSRRFWRLGALLLFPVILNVALINWAMDLWFDTRIISVCLLAGDAFLMSRSLSTYVSLVHSLTPKPSYINGETGRSATRFIFPVLTIGTVGLYIFLFNLPYVRAIRNEGDLIGARQINGTGTWAVQQATVNGHEVAGGADRRLYFDFWGKCVFTAPGQELKGTFKSNSTDHTIEITGVALTGDSSPIKGTYQLSGDQIVVQAEQSNHIVLLNLKKWKWGPIWPFHS